jgi:3,4-dihydroxy-2-butanone 4-phosphate synthase
LAGNGGGFPAEGRLNFCGKRVGYWREEHASATCHLAAAAGRRPCEVTCHVASTLDGHNAMA